MEPSFQQWFDEWVRENFMFLLLGGVALWYAFRRVKEQVVVVQSDRTRKVLTDEERLAAMAEARARQQAYVLEKTKEDEELRKARKAQELADKLRLRDEAAEKDGNKLGGDEPKPRDTKRGAQPPPKADDTTDDKGERGPMKKLPKLPGGERDHYRPSYGQSGGSSYKPSGFKRPSRGG